MDSLFGQQIRNDAFRADGGGQHSTDFCGISDVGPRSRQDLEIVGEKKQIAADQ